MSFKTWCAYSPVHLFRVVFPDIDMKMGEHPLTVLPQKPDISTVLTCDRNVSQSDVWLFGLLWSLDIQTSTLPWLFSVILKFLVPSPVKK